MFFFKVFIDLFIFGVMIYISDIELVRTNPVLVGYFWLTNPRPVVGDLFIYEQLTLSPFLAERFGPSLGWFPH